MPVFEKDPEKSVSRLQRRLHQAMVKTVGPMYESKDHKSVGVFKGMWEDLEKSKKELAGAILREKDVISQYQRLVKKVHAVYTAAYGGGETPDLSDLLQQVAESAKDLNNSISNVQLHSDKKSTEQPHDYFQRRPEDYWRMSQEWLRLGVEEEINKSSAAAALELLRRKSYDRLKELKTRLCLLCFAVFPDNYVIKKRLLIYWWMGEGIITAASERNKTAEEVGDKIFEELIREGVIVAVKDCSSSPIVNRCLMNPWTRDMLVSVAREACFFDFDSSGEPSDSFAKSLRSCLVSSDSGLSSSRDVKKKNAPGTSSNSNPKEEDLVSVFNVSREILAFKIDWLSKLKRIEVLQLGRWQYWCEHHIEVEDDQIFKSLGSQKLLKYLSLRGISRISQLPDSLSGLLNLEILDLKACHNLETLPDISSLKKLTHLDLSECYLLESMPKGIAKLTSLQVLKGFVIGNSARNTSKLNDLAKLKKLRRLSIFLGRNAVVENNEYASLKEISSLRCLTITWGPKTKESQSFPFVLPETLEKIDLRGFPLDKTPEWLDPRKLTKLKKLYLRGGELKSLKIDDQGGNRSWGVEILRLKFMSNFSMELLELKTTLPNLKYLEKIKCRGVNIVWPEAKEGHDQDHNVLQESAANKEKESCDQEQPQGAAEEGEITQIA